MDRYKTILGAALSEMETMIYRDVELKLVSSEQVTKSRKLLDSFKIFLRKQDIEEIK